MDLTFHIPKQIEEIFTSSEIEFLKKHGMWMSELESGQKLPKSVMQNDFLKVCRGQKEPTEEHEILWVRFKKTSWIFHHLDNSHKLVDAHSNEIQALEAEIQDREFQIGQLESQLSKEIGKVEAFLQRTKNLEEENQRKHQTLAQRETELNNYKQESQIIDYLSEFDITLIKSILAKRDKEKRKQERILKDCLCRGTNSDCQKCFGRGAYLVDGNGALI